MRLMDLLRAIRRRLRGDWLQHINRVPVVRPEIMDTLPHDPSAFTQGLLYHNGSIYESTGLYGGSSLRQMDLRGTVLHYKHLPNVFAEGIALIGDEMVQLTWHDHIAYRYAYPDLKQRGQFTYAGEGWGLTSNAVNFIMSDGTGVLQLRDPQFGVIGKIRVTLNNRLVNRMNDLTFARDKIYANVWRHDFLLEIDPGTGSVCRVIDCSEIVHMENCTAPEGVLNGIAYNEDGNLFYVTGKGWQKIYVITIPHA